MVLEGANGTLSGVSAVDVGRGHLDGEFVFVVKPGFERGGSLVV